MRWQAGAWRARLGSVGCMWKAGSVMTVLCLLELDGTAAADASVRAVTLARSLGDTSVRTVVFGDSGQVPAAALADYGVTDVYAVEPGSVDGYARLAWARVLA